jgi:hypothetical protein
MLSRFPAAFRRPAFASWVILRPLGNYASLTVGRPGSNHLPGPHRGCPVAHEQDATGQGAPLTPRTAVRSRPAITTQPAPAAFQRPVPTAPLKHPIGGGHLHEASTGVHSRSPIPPGHPNRAPDAGTALRHRPTGLLLACSSRMEREPLGFFPELRTPQSPATHVEAETGHHALARVLHLRPQSNLQQRLLLALMHPQVAHSPTSIPSPPR